MSTPEFKTPVLIDSMVHTLMEKFKDTTPDDDVNCYIEAISHGETSGKIEWENYGDDDFTARYILSREEFWFLYMDISIPQTTLTTPVIQGDLKEIDIRVGLRIEDDICHIVNIEEVDVPIVFEEYVCRSLDEWNYILDVEIRRFVDTMSEWNDRAVIVASMKTPDLIDEAIKSLQHSAKPIVEPREVPSLQTYGRSGSLIWYDENEGRQYTRLLLMVHEKEIWSFYVDIAANVYEGKAFMVSVHFHFDHSRAALFAPKDEPLIREHCYIDSMDGWNEFLQNNIVKHAKAVEEWKARNNFFMKKSAF